MCDGCYNNLRHDDHNSTRVVMHSAHVKAGACTMQRTNRNDEERESTLAQTCVRGCARGQERTRVLVDVHLSMHTCMREREGREREPERQYTESREKGREKARRSKRVCVRVREGRSKPDCCGCARCVRKDRVDVLDAAS